MNKVLILGQARSGSTYFKNNLNRHEECFFLNEPLAPGIVSPTAGTWTRNVSTRPHCGLDGPRGRSIISDKEWLSCMETLINDTPNNYFYKVLDMVSKNTEGKCKNIGIKLFWNHNNASHGKIYDKRNYDNLPNDWWLDKNLAENIIPKFNKFIILNRPVEETLFSRVKSMTTNSWGTAFRERTRNTYPTFKEFMHSLYIFSNGKIKTKAREDYITECQIRYHVGAESFCRYMESKYDSLSVDYNNINWEEVSDYLGMKVEDKLGYNKFEYDLERWFRENPEFKHICDEVKEQLFRNQKQYTF
jgi:hypothetical protein